MSRALHISVTFATLTATAFACSQAAAFVQTRESGEADVEFLIESLTSPVFSERTAAHKSLLSYGDAAIAPVKAALKTAGPEKTLRLKNILNRLEADTFSGRLSALEKTPTPESAARMPQWERYQSLLGTDRDAVDFYIRLVKSEAELFRLADQSVTSLRNPLQIRATQLAESNRNGELPIDSYAAVLLLASNNEVILRSDTSTNLTACLTGQFAEQLDSTDGKRLRRLAGQWILRRAISVPRPLEFARRHRLPEGLVLARRTLKGVLRRGDAIPAMMLLKEQGTRDDVEILESLFDQTRKDYNERAGQGILFRGRRTSDQYVCYHGDLALALAIAMRGGHPYEFGFNVDPRNAPPARFAFTEGTTGFSSEDQRQAALTKYREAYGR